MIFDLMLNGASPLLPHRGTNDGTKKLFHQSSYFTFAYVVNKMSFTLSPAPLPHPPVLQKNGGYAQYYKQK